jgi:hypothetical protein
MVRLFEAAAMSLPTILPPGSDALSLAVFSYIYRPFAVAQKLAAASASLTAPLPVLPTAEQASSILLENRAAGMLGLMPEASGKHGGQKSGPGASAKTPRRQGFLQPLESMLPLRMDWIFFAVRLVPY